MQQNWVPSLPQAGVEGRDHRFLDHEFGELLVLLSIQPIYEVRFVTINC